VKEQHDHRVLVLVDDAQRAVGVSVAAAVPLGENSKLFELASLDDRLGFVRRLPRGLVRRVLVRAVLRTVGLLVGRHVSPVDDIGVLGVVGWVLGVVGWVLGVVGWVLGVVGRVLVVVSPALASLGTRGSDGRLDALAPGAAHVPVPRGPMGGIRLGTVVRFAGKPRAVGECRVDGGQLVGDDV